MSRGRLLLACGLCVAAGALLRALPITNEFWLDEIWTYWIARELASPLEVFSTVHHSNNHHLNTLFFYLLGERPHWAWYRLPSLLAGSVSIALAAGIAARRGRLEAVLAALLFAASFALVHFSSEARGYALAVCWALAAHWTLQLHLERPRAWTAGAFWLACVLGPLSHLSFLFYYAGALLQSGRRAAHAGAARSFVAQLAVLHAIPLTCLAALYLVDLRALEVGAGPPFEFRQLLARTVGFGFGLPVWPRLGAAYGLLAAALLVSGVHLLRRLGDDAWLVFPVTIALAPISLFALLRPEVVAVRYLLVGIAFALLLLAYLLAGWLQAGGWRRGGALLLLALFLAGNGVHFARFAESGRGGFRSALHFMADHSPGLRIEVGSDHDFRNERVLRFYARGLRGGRWLDYRPRAQWPEHGPEWILVHRLQRPPRPLPEIAFDGGLRYRLEAEFDHAGISGFWCAVYRNLDAR